MPIRAKVDEDLPAEIAELLRKAGHDAWTILGQGLQGILDVPLWSRVQEEGRSIFTADKGIANAREHPPGTHAGVVLFRLPRESRSGYINLARFFISNFDLERIPGRIIVVTPNHIRVQG